MVKNIFIHLDDEKAEIREAIMEVLKLATRVQTESFIEIAEDWEKKFSHKSLCKELI